MATTVHPDGIITTSLDSRLQAKLIDTLRDGTRVYAVQFFGRNIINRRTGCIETAAASQICNVLERIARLPEFGDQVA